MQNTGLAGTSALLDSPGGDPGSLLSSLADLSTQYHYQNQNQNQRLLSDLGRAGHSDAGSNALPGGTSSESSPDATSTTTSNATANATPQALSLHPTHQQGLSHLLASA